MELPPLDTAGVTSWEPCRPVQVDTAGVTSWEPCRPVHGLQQSLRQKGGPEGAVTGARKVVHVDRTSAESFLKARVPSAECHPSHCKPALLGSWIQSQCVVGRRGACSTTPSNAQTTPGCPTDSPLHTHTRTHTHTHTHTCACMHSLQTPIQNPGCYLCFLRAVNQRFLRPQLGLDSFAKEAHRP